MLLLLLFLNAVLVVAVFAASLRGRRPRAGLLRLEATGAMELLEDAYSADPGAATQALLLAAGTTESAGPVLVPSLSLAGSPHGSVRLAAAATIRAALDNAPGLLPLCWPCVSPTARAAVLSSVPPWSSDSPAFSAAQIVIDGLADSDDIVRRAACGRLDAIENDRALALASQLIDDRDEEVRRLAYLFIGRRGRVQDLDPLLDRLAAAPPAHAPIILDALSALGRRHHSRLAQIAVTPGERRLPALRGLGVTGEPEGAAILLKALSESDPGVRRVAAAALAEAVRCQPALRSASHLGTDVVRLFLRETSTSTTLAMLEVIEMVGSPDAGSAIASRLDTMNPAVRERADEVRAALERKRRV